jgi:ketosteroid isomerase-like protein
MARSNIEIQQELIAAFNEGSVEAVLPFFDPDVEVYDPDLPEGGTYKGREGVRHMLDLMLSGNDTTEVLDFRMVPAGDRVVVMTHTRVRGKPGQPDIEVRDAHLMTYRDGKVVYWRLYLDRDEALGDAGLDPTEVLGP